MKCQKKSENKNQKNDLQGVMKKDEVTKEGIVEKEDGRNEAKQNVKRRQNKQLKKVQIEKENAEIKNRKNDRNEIFEAHDETKKNEKTRENKEENKLEKEIKNGETDNEEDDVVVSESYVLLEFPDLINANILTNNFSMSEDARNHVSTNSTSMISSSSFLASCPYVSSSSITDFPPCLNLYDLDSKNPKAVINQMFYFRGHHEKSIGTNVFFQIPKTSSSNYSAFTSENLSSSPSFLKKEKQMYPEIECHSTKIIQFECDTAPALF